MTEGVFLFLRALKVLLRNPGAMLGVTIGPLVLGLGLPYLALRLAALLPSGLAPALPQRPVLPAESGTMEELAALVGLLQRADTAIVLIGFLLIGGTAFGWAAVAWHRCIILNERPGVLPPFSPGRIAGYLFWWLLGAAVQVVLFLLAFNPYFGPLFYLGLMSPVLTAILATGLLVVSVIVCFRMSALMVSAAVEDGTDVIAVWEASGENPVALVVMALAAAVFTSKLSDLIWAAASMVSAGPYLTVALVTLGFWLNGMIGLSVITTVYHRYVEGAAD